MSKVLVCDILETRRQLHRLANYAYRHMDNLPILEANVNVKAARELLANNMVDFLETDVSSLHKDTTDIEEMLTRYIDKRDELKDEISHYEKQIIEIIADAKLDDYEPDTEWEEERIEYCKDRRKELKRENKELKAQL